MKKVFKILLIVMLLLVNLPKAYEASGTSAGISGVNGEPPSIPPNARWAIVDYMDAYDGVLYSYKKHDGTVITVQFPQAITNIPSDVNWVVYDASGPDYDYNYVYSDGTQLHTVTSVAAIDKDAVWAIQDHTEIEQDALTDIRYYYPGGVVDNIYHVPPNVNWVVTNDFMGYIYGENFEYYYGDAVAAKPNPPSILGLNPSSDSGASNTDNITNDDTPTFVGTAEVNTTVNISSNGIPVGTTTANGSGAWSFTTATPMSEGTHAITATATNAGGTSNPSAALTIIIDKTVPTTGVISSSNVTTSGVTLNWPRATDSVTALSNLEYRIYQSTSSNFNTVSEVENGSPLGSGFAKDIGTYNVGGLLPNTTYYFNVIVKDLAGNKSTYTMKEVKTNSHTTVPLVTTNSSATSVTATSVKVSGNVTSDGNAPITERGIVYSTTANPTINSNKVTAPGTTGTFTVDLTSLDQKIKYFYRAFATNSVGTSYGEERVFTTKSNIAALINLSIAPFSLNKQFDSDTINYSATVPSGTTEVTVNAMAADSNATIDIVGASSGKVTLDADGTTDIRVEVTAEDGTTKAYTVTIYRLRPAPSVTADDDNNIILGIDNSMEYQIDGGTWTTFNVMNLPDLSGDKVVKVRYSEDISTGQLASEEATLTFTKNPKIASVPNVTPATTAEDTMSMSGLVITPDSQDINDVTHYKISEITGGTLYKNDGTFPIENGNFITKEEGEAGLKFTPNTDANTSAGGTFSFKIQAALDGTGKGLSNATTASITVTEVNDNPIASDDTLSSVEENSPSFVIPAAALLSNDSEGPANESSQTLTITNITNAVGGTVSFDGTNITFTPQPNYQGMASFNYTIQDNGTTNGVPSPQTSEGSVSFMIEARANQPTVTNAVTNEDEKNSEGLVIAPTIGGATTTHYKITGITGGTLYKNDGVTHIFNGDFITVSEGQAGLKFHPSENLYGTTGFGFLIQAAPSTNGTRLSDPIQASITVKEVNDAPIATVDSLGNKEINSQGITILFEELLQNDKQGPDNENDQTLTVKSVENAVGGTVQIQGGKIIFNPSGIGPASFNYTIEDNGRTASVDDFKTASATVQFTVVDTQGPVVVLNGDSEVFIPLGSAYMEPGYSASDEVDGDLTSSISLTGTVDTNQLGTYQLKYNVSDLSNNNAVEVTRTIHVVSSELQTLSVSSGDLSPLFDPDEIAYTVNVSSNTANIDITVSPLDPTASAVLNGQTIGNGGTQSISLQPGVNTISIVVTARGGRTKTYTIIVKRAQPPSSGGGGGSTPEPAPAPQPTTEQIVVDVDGNNGSNLTKTPITRTTEPNGTVKDKVAMTDAIAKETVQKAKEQGVDTARIIIPDKEDKVSEVLVEVPKAALDELNNGNLKLEIATPNAVISIPTTSIDNFNENLYFRVVPIKSNSEKQQVEQRAKNESLIQEAVGNNTVQVLGRPMEIETNMQNREVAIILPLTASLPTNAAERQNILNNLGVYIEHSDGSKELIKGTVVKMQDGSEGLQFTVNKFSTFTMVYLGGWNEEIIDETIHTPYIKGYGNNEFRPNAPVTRTQMATMLARNLDATPSTQTYEDVPANHRAYAAIMEVKGAGIMTGKNASTFDPNGTVTRAQMAAIVYRWVQNQCKQDPTSYASCEIVTNIPVANFTDVKDDHWAKEAISFTKAANIMVGDGKSQFQPAEKLTRAQAVKVLNRLFKRGPLKGITTPSFKDVPTKHWAFDEIEEAAREHKSSLDLEE